MFEAMWLAERQQTLLRTARRFTRRRIDDGIDAARSVLNTVPDAVVPTRREEHPFIPTVNQLSDSPVMSLQSKLQIAVADGQLYAQK